VVHVRTETMEPRLSRTGLETPSLKAMRLSDKLLSTYFTVVVLVEGVYCFVCLLSMIQVVMLPAGKTSFIEPSLSKVMSETCAMSSVLEVW
jgi:hypothetical protein